MITSILEDRIIILKKSIMKPILTSLSFIFCFISSYSQIWKAYLDSGKAYQGQGNIEKAIFFYNQANQEMKKDSLGTLSYASSCMRLGNLYYSTQKYQKAEPLYLEAKQIREKVLGKQDPAYSSVCGNLANLYADIGQYRKAEPLYLEARQIREKMLGKEDLTYADACYNLATLYFDMGQYSKAVTYSLEAKKIREKMLDKEDLVYAASCRNLAMLYQKLNEYQLAELLYLEVKKIREKALGKEDVQYALSCADLASYYYDIGQLDKAEQLFLEAQQIEEKVIGTEHIYYYYLCNGLAAVYHRRKNYSKAEILYLKSKAILENIVGSEDPKYATFCNNFALFYTEQGQYAKAEPLNLEAKRIREKVFGKKNPDYAFSCITLAELYQAIGQFKKAELLYLEAKKIRQKVLRKKHPDYGLSCNELAGLYWIEHQTPSAEKEYKESFSINVYNVNSIFQFTNEKEKEDFIKNVLGEDDKAYSFYLAAKLNSNLPYSLSLFHRNLILSSSNTLKKQIFSANDTTLNKKYIEWINNKKNLADLYSRPIAGWKEDAVKIEEKASELEKEITRLSSSYRKTKQVVDWKVIQSKLKGDEISIEFSSFHFYNGKRDTDSIYYVANMLRKDAPMPSMIFLFEEKKLTELLASTGNQTNNDGVKALYTSRGADEDNIVINKSIYQLIWKPLEVKLKGIKTIYFAPAGILHRIAFAALPINNKELLSDKYRLVQLATTTSVTERTQTFITASDKIALYGGIIYDVDSTEFKGTINFKVRNPIEEKTTPLPTGLIRSSSFSYLPGTQTEIENIEKQAKREQIQVKTLSGINATEESFKELDGKSSPSVIHIASHGFFFPDPGKNKGDFNQNVSDKSGAVFKISDNPLFRSGLLFAGAEYAWKGTPIQGIEDGILTAYDVSNMYLPNTKLVVLSACETALGQILGSEGVYGLQRAFKIAGVQNLMMSLWKVPDAETAEFMGLFYKNLFAKQSISDAFHNTQNVMKNKYRYEPYKWAAWILLR